MRKAIIGIVTKHRQDDKEINRPDTHIRNEVKQAIFDNGAIAIGIISANKDILFSTDDWQKYDRLINKEDIISQIKLCDGIVLQGGDASEAYENWIAKYCYENDIPTLGLCGGQNSMVRGLGGSTKKIPNPEKHMRINDTYVHNIKINKDSEFYKIIKKEEIMVNSRHKRSPDRHPNLEVVGVCEDGYADVVESKDKKFFIGVRFHPESLYEIDENMNNIFKKFIEVCENNIME